MRMMTTVSSPWRQGCHGGSRRGGTICTLSGRCTSFPQTPLKKDILLENTTLKINSFNNVHLLNKYEGNIQIHTRFHRINDMMYSMCSWDLKIAIVCLFLLEKGRQEKVALKPWTILALFWLTQEGQRRLAHCNSFHFLTQKPWF